MISFAAGILAGLIFAFVAFCVLAIMAFLKR